MDEAIKQALEVLNSGGIILYPTDTVWGIGCDATNPAAVSKVLELKQRKHSKGMVILVDISARIPSYVREVPEIAWELIDVTDKPLTIIYPGAKNLASNVIAPDGSIGIRVVSQDFCKRLIARFKRPLVSTSANISGDATPKSFPAIPDRIKTGGDLVGSQEFDSPVSSAPSSVIKLGLTGEIEIIRP